MKPNKTSKQKDPCFRTATVHAISTSNVDWNVLYPEIKLSGQWLYRRGFHPGRKVKIKSTGTDLIISLIK